MLKNTTMCYLNVKIYAEQHILKNHFYKNKKRVDLYLPFSNLTKPIKLIKPKLMK